MVTVQKNTQNPLNTYLYYVMLCYITVQYSTVQYSILYFKYLIKKKVKISLEMPVKYSSNSERKPAAATWATLSDLQQGLFYMHHPTDRIAHTTNFITPVVGLWLEREIVQWVHHEVSIWLPIVPWANALTTELHLAPYMLHYITLHYIIIHPLNTYLYYVMLCYITVQYSTIQYSILYFKYLIKKS